MKVTPALCIVLVCLTRTLIQAQINCTETPCENYGTCLPDGSCNCRAAYDGDYCEGVVIDITLTDGQDTIDEGEYGTFTFIRQNSTGVLDVTYEFSGTFNASADTDRTLTNGTLRFPDTDRREQISFEVIADGENEVAETITITITQGTYIDSKTLTINPSDPIIVTAITPKSEGSGALDANCTFPSGGGSLTFNVTASDGTAQLGSDYGGSEVTVTCTDAQPTVDLLYSAIDSDVPELDETFQFTFTYPAESYAITGGGVVTIEDNDKIDINVTLPDPLPETWGNVSLSDFITIDVGPATGVTFDLEITFSPIAGATAGVDYEVAETTFTMTYDPDNIVASFEDRFLSITDDIIDEPHTEGIQINFTSAYALSGDVTTSRTIEDDDDPTVTIAVGPEQFENETTRIIILTRNSSFDGLTLDVSASPTSAQSDEYSFGDTSVSFGSGTTVIPITVTIIDDEIVENDETVSLTFVGSTTTVNFDPSNITVIPINNDDEYYNVSTRVHRGATNVDSLAEEDGIFNISLTRISSVGTLDVTVTVTSADGAGGDDFTFVPQMLQFRDGETEIDSFSVQILDDEIPEPTETLIVTTTWQTFTDTATVSILDTDPFNVTISGMPYITEEDGFYNYTLTRNADHKSTMVGITYLTDPGSSDFSGVGSQTVTFQQNELTAVVSVPLTDDADREQDDSVTIQVVGIGDLIVGEPIDFDLTVVNDDLDNVVATAVDTLEDVGLIVVSVTRNAIFEDLNVTITAGACSNPRCVSNDDYSLPTPIFTFLAGQNNMLINIDINTDTDHEADEILILDFTPEAAKALPTSLTVRILNDDPETVTLPLLVGAFEDEGEISVELTRTLDLDPFTVNITTVDDTAVAGVDFLQLSSESVTFPGGSLKAYVDINITDNSVDDPDRMFQIQVTGLINDVPDKDVHIFDDEGGRPFNCLRNGQNCTEEGDVCFSLPICYCSDTNRRGDRCNILTDHLIPCVPADKCSGNGVCTDVASDCTCNDDYYGEACENYFLHNICNISSMVVIINPVGYFDGSIYVFGYSEVEECQFKPLADLGPGVITDNTLKGYGLVINHVNSSCGDIVPVENGDITSYTRGIFVAYTTGIQKGTDQYVNAACSFNNSNIELVIGNMTIVEDSDAFVQENVRNLASPVIMDAFIGSVSLTPASIVALDSDVGFRVSVPEPFQGLAIRNIWLENGLTGNDTQVFWLYKDGCKIPEASGILGTIKYETENNVLNKAALTFDYSAIAFDSSDRVVTYVTLRICVNSTHCDVPCESTTRRKRATSGDTTVWTMFRVDAANYRPGSSKDSIIRSSDSTSGPAILEEQSGTTQFVPTIAGLGVAAVILILICCIVLFVLLRRRRKPLKMEY